jgi:hypothetical protein
MKRETVLAWAVGINLLSTCALIYGGAHTILNAPPWLRIDEAPMSSDIYTLIGFCVYAALQGCLLVWRPKPRASLTTIVAKLPLRNV